MMNICKAVLLGLFLAQTGLAQFTYYAPHVVLGNLGGGHSWQTVFQFVNTSPTQVNLTISLKNDDGSPLLGFTAPRVLTPTSMASLSMDPLSAGRIQVNPNDSVQGTSGWAFIEATGSLMVSVLVEDTTATCVPVPDSPGACSNIISVNTSTTLIDASGKDFVFSGGFNPSPFFATAVAVLNPSAIQSATITLQLLQRDGSPLREVTFSLPPQTKIAQFVHELGLFQSVGGGTVRLRSSQPASLAVVEIRDGAWISVPAGFVP